MRYRWAYSKNQKKIGGHRATFAARLNRKWPNLVIFAVLGVVAKRRRKHVSSFKNEEILNFLGKRWVQLCILRWWQGPRTVPCSSSGCWARLAGKHAWAPRPCRYPQLASNTWAGSRTAWVPWAPAHPRRTPPCGQTAARTHVLLPASWSRTKWLRWNLKTDDRLLLCS